jgi:hypothetical protein
MMWSGVKQEEKQEISPFLGSETRRERQASQVNREIIEVTRLTHGCHLNMMMTMMTMMMVGMDEAWTMEFFYF